MLCGMFSAYLAARMCFVDFFVLCRTIFPGFLLCCTNRFCNCTLEQGYIRMCFPEYFVLCSTICLGFFLCCTNPFGKCTSEQDCILLHHGVHYATILSICHHSIIARIVTFISTDFVPTYHKHNIGTQNVQTSREVIESLCMMIGITS